MRYLDTRLIGISPSGAYLGSLPDDLGYEISGPFMDFSTISLKYPDDGIRSELCSIGSAVSVQLGVVDTDSDEASEWYDFPGNVWLLAEHSDNDTEQRVVSEMKGISLLRLLEGEVIGQENKAASTSDGHRNYGRVTAGRAMRIILQTVMMRQRPSNLPWFPQLTWNFTDTHDSNGKPWAKDDLFTMPRQATVHDALEKLTGYQLVEWEMRGFELVLANPGTLGRRLDTGLTPTIIRNSAVTDAPNRSSLNDLCTDVDMAGDDDLWWEFGTPDAWSTWGRFVRPIQQGAVSLATTAGAYAEKLLKPGRQPRVEYTRDCGNGTNIPLPWIDVRNGDWVLIENDYEMISVEVKGVSISRSDTGQITWHWTLADKIESWLAKLSSKSDAAASGSGVQNGDGTPIRPPTADKSVPAAVTDISLSSTVYQDPATGITQGSVIIDWEPVTLDTSGDPMTQVSYEVWGRTSGQDTPHFLTLVPQGQSQIDVGPFEPRTLWEFQVRAVSSTGIYGAFSPARTISIDYDRSAPYVPTKPILSTKGGTIEITWDGKGVNPNTGQPFQMPADFSSVIVWDYGEDSSSSPVSIGRIAGTRDSDFIMVARVAGTRHFFAFSAVDTSGNESPLSPQSEIRVRSVADDPEEINAIGANLIEDSAWIGNLRAQIITVDFLKGRRIEGGTIATGPTSTNRIELSEAGYIQYDAQNRKLASWEPGAGIRLFNLSGQVTTQLSTQDYGLSVRNPVNGVLTPASSIIFGGAMNQTGAPAQWLDFGLYPGQESGWIEAGPSDTFTWQHHGARAVVWFTFEAYSTLNGVNPPINSVKSAFRIYRVSDNVRVYDSSGNLAGTLAPPGIPYANDSDQAYFQGTGMAAFMLAPGTYRFVRIWRVGSGTSGSGVGHTSIRERSVAIAQW